MKLHLAAAARQRPQDQEDGMAEGLVKKKERPSGPLPFSQTVALISARGS